MARLWFPVALLFLSGFFCGCACQLPASNSASYVHIRLYKITSPEPEKTLEKVLKDIEELLLPVPTVKGFWVGRPVPKPDTVDYLVDADYDLGILFLFTAQRGLAEFEQHPSYAEFESRNGDSLEVRAIDFSPYRPSPPP